MPTHGTSTRTAPGTAKASKDTSPSSRLFTAVALTSGYGPDNHEAAVAAGVLADKEEGTELTVLGGSAYGTGDLRAQLEADGHTLVIKPPPMRQVVPGGFTIDDFLLDVAAGTATSPAGHRCVQCKFPQPLDDLDLKAPDFVPGGRVGADLMVRPHSRIDCSAPRPTGRAARTHRSPRSSWRRTYRLPRSRRPGGHEGEEHGDDDEHQPGPEVRLHADLGLVPIRLVVVEPGCKAASARPPDNSGQ